MKPARKGLVPISDLFRNCWVRKFLLHRERGKVTKMHINTLWKIYQVVSELILFNKLIQSVIKNENNP